MMKYTNLIKLLSVLLCAIMLFTACNGGGNAATDAKTGSDATTNETGSATDSGTENNAGDNTDAVTLPGVIGPVEPILKNFFTVGTAPVWKELGVATRLDGDCVSKTEDDTVIVLRKATIDHLNNVKETFTVYNTVLATTVLTLEHSYENGNYGAFSWNRDTYSNPKLIFPDTKMKVEVDTVSGYGEDLPYIKVSKATIVAIDEKVFEENEGNSHEVKFAYDYYDIGGQLITSSDIDYVRAQYDDGIARAEAFIFGGVVATFDPDTNLVINTVGVDNKIIRYNYTDENAKYGYYLNRYSRTLLGNTNRYFEVYNKADNTLAFRYEFDVAKGMGSAFVLDGGNIIVQYVKLVPADEQIPYDFTMMSMRYRINSYLVDVATGVEKEIDLKYYISEFYNKDDFAEIFDPDRNGITLTANTTNIAVAMDISAKRNDYNTMADLIVLNNDGSVMYKLDKIVPEHKIGDYHNSIYGEYDPFGYIQLPSGDYLVTLETVTAGRAIVSADGKVRSYLNSGAKIAGSYVVQSSGIYDYDMNRLFEFNETNGYTFEFTIGNEIIVSKVITMFEVGATEPVTTKKYYRMNWNGTSFEALAAFENNSLSEVRCTTDYVIVKNEKNGKYSMYNAKLEHVLTTNNEMSVFLCDGKYIVSTDLTVEGVRVTLFYTIA